MTWDEIPVHTCRDCAAESRDPYWDGWARAPEEPVERDVWRCHACHVRYASMVREEQRRAPSYPPPRRWPW